MSYSAELLERYKTAKGFGSDRQAAIALGVAPPFMTQIKDGRRHWSDDKAIHMAESCGIDPREALAGIALDKAAPEHRGTMGRHRKAFAPRSRLRGGRGAADGPMG